MIYKNGVYNSKENIEMRTAILDAERQKKPVTFYTRSRRMITQFTCIDTPCEPFTLSRFTMSGGLIYYKKSRYEWGNISEDDILQVVI